MSPLTILGIIFGSALCWLLLGAATQGLIYVSLMLSSKDQEELDREWEWLDDDVLILCWVASPLAFIFSLIIVFVIVIYRTFRKYLEYFSKDVICEKEIKNKSFGEILSNAYYKKRNGENE